MTSDEADSFEQRLRVSFPNLFKRPTDPKESLPIQKWGIECGSGWFEIIRTLCERINGLEPLPEGMFAQIKEKNGNLRVYWSAPDGGFKDDERVETLVNYAERMSSLTDEETGKVKGHLKCRECGSYNLKFSSFCADDMPDSKECIECLECGTELPFELFDDE